jgi:outer membrane protein TolC
MPGSTIDVRPGALLRLPPAPPALDGSPTDPRVAAQDARIEASKARRRVIETGTLPRLDLVGAIWGRASGADDTGFGAHGLVPDVPNWALGVVVTWPVFAGATVAPQKHVEDALIARDRAREREIRDDIAGEVAQAHAILDGAYRAAENTPVALKAARDAEQQATARYRAQLSTADDVAQAQRLLEQAEIDDAVARLDVWRAILFGAFAAGDLDRFTKLYHQAGG